MLFPPKNEEFRCFLRKILENTINTSDFQLRTRIISRLSGGKRALSPGKEETPRNMSDFLRDCREFRGLREGFLRNSE